VRAAEPEVAGLRRALEAAYEAGRAVMMGRARRDA